MNGAFDSLYAYDVSEGALYILFALVLLTHPESPNIFALDNVDNALNPGLVSKLMSKIIEIVDADDKKQLFITTHNPTTLDALDIFNDAHRLFVVQRKEDGQTEFNRITPPKNMTKAQWQEHYLGLKLSEIWLSGAIGGLPIGF
jgi:predicted ATPase